jgi:hypothetical protein
MAAIFRLTRTWAATSTTVVGFRERRYRLFVDLCSVEPDDRIIDVGAGNGGGLERFNRENPIVAVDLQGERTGWLDQPNVTVEKGDGTQLRFAAREFPVAYSNSVVEHIPKKLQQAFADEVRRVADRYFVQTPNRWFPIEPHYQVPLFHFLPKRIRQAINKRFTLGFQPKGHWEEITLLSARDMKRLFPDAVIHRERVLGLTKSLMAVRGGPNA